MPENEEPPAMPAGIFFYLKKEVLLLSNNLILIYVSSRLKFENTIEIVRRITMKNVSEVKGKVPFIVSVGLLWALYALYAGSIFEILELIGIFVFTFNSAKYALNHWDKHKHIKYFFCFMAAFICTFGGGVFRDLFLLSRVPALLVNTAWIIIAICGIAFGLIYSNVKYRMNTVLSLFEIIDYTAVIVFIQGGYELAIDYGLTQFMALFCGIVTGCGGGIFVTLLFYRRERTKVLSTYDSIGNSLLGAVVLSFFDFKQDARAIITWLLISVYKVESVFIRNTIINAFTINKSLIYRHIRLVYELYEPSLRIPDKPRLFDYSYLKLCISLYRKIKRRAWRINFKLKNLYKKHREWQQRSIFYFRSAVKTFA